MSEASDPAPPRCSYCGAALVIIHVHGHGQCSACGTNVDPCCAGASPESEASVPLEKAPPVDQAALRRAFQEAGGAQSTVTEAAFLFALARVLDAPLDDAAVALDAAVEIGLVRRIGGAVRAANPPA